METPRAGCSVRDVLFTLNIVSLSGTGALNLKVEPRQRVASATKRAQSKLHGIFQAFHVNGGQTWRGDGSTRRLSRRANTRSTRLEPEYQYPLPLPRYSIIILIIPCLDTRCLDIRVESWPRRWIYASPSN